MAAQYPLPDSTSDRRSAPDIPLIIAISGDPGGASALAPVIAMLRADGKVRVQALAYLQAIHVWTDKNLHPETLGDALEDKDIQNLLGQPGAALLLTGTSINPYEYEKRFLRIARTIGLSALSVLDFWSNYSERFSDFGRHLCYLPGRVAVMDEHARTEMLAKGFPEDSLVITGHPALDSLADYRDAFSKAERNEVRHSLGVSEHELLVLFASQPPTFVDNEKEHDTPSWLDRKKTVTALIRALERISERLSQPITLLIRPHPRENGEVYQQTACNRIRVKVEKGGDSRRFALSADLVAGMNTMFLVEACHLGQPTLSIRLGLPQPDDFPPNRLKMTHPVYREEALEEVLMRLLEEARSPLSQASQAGKASRNVAKLAYSMLGI